MILKVLSARRLPSCAGVATFPLTFSLFARQKRLMGPPVDQNPKIGLLVYTSNIEIASNTELSSYGHTVLKQSVHPATTNTMVPPPAATVAAHALSPRSIVGRTSKLVSSLRLRAFISNRDTWATTGQLDHIVVFAATTAVENVSKRLIGSLRSRLVAIAS